MGGGGYAALVSPPQPRVGLVARTASTVGVALVAADLGALTTDEAEAAAAAVVRGVGALPDSTRLGVEWPPTSAAALAPHGRGDSSPSSARPSRRCRCSAAVRSRSSRSSSSSRAAWRSWPSSTTAAASGPWDDRRGRHRGRIRPGRGGHGPRVRPRGSAGDGARGGGVGRAGQPSHRSAWSRCAASTGTKGSPWRWVGPPSPTPRVGAWAEAVRSTPACTTGHRPACSNAGPARTGSTTSRPRGWPRTTRPSRPALPCSGSPRVSRPPPRCFVGAPRRWAGPGWTCPVGPHPNPTGAALQ